MKDRIKNLSLKWKLFFCFLIFTLISLSILWIFQTIFLDDFYEAIKIKKIKDAAQSIEQNIGNSEIDTLASRLAQDGEMCIILYNSDGSLVADEDLLMGCMLHNVSNEQRAAFNRAAIQNGGEYLSTFSLDIFKSQYNDRFFKGDVPKADPGMYDSLIYVKTFTANGQDYVVMLNSAITPVSATVETVSTILRIVTGLLIVLSMILALILSKNLSKPISKLNSSAKLLATGNYDVDFTAQGYKEISELSNNLRYAANELSKVDDYRKDLLANPSHDLRTPLTLIAGYGQMMQDIPEEISEENLQVIVDEAQRLTDLVNDVLDLSKYSSGEFTLNKEQFNLSELLDETMERYNKLREKEGYTIDFETQPDILIMADKVKLTQVIYNLINNAINYTGEIKVINVSLAEKDGVCRFSVKDNGEGIPADKLSSIWNRYYKIDKTHKRSQIGTGLGLSIVKGILDAHSVRYGVDSAVGVGSVFWFEFPIVKNP